MGARAYNLPTEEIAARYNAGESIPQLAAAFDCAQGTISKRLDWAGVVRRPGGRKLSPVPEIVRAYKAGQKVERIAARFKMDSSAICRIAHRHGCAKRRKTVADVERYRIARELRAQGLSWEKVGEQMGISKPTARNWAAKGELER